MWVHSPNTIETHIPAITGSTLERQIIHLIHIEANTAQF
jgi:hypothetical protein